jgi:hypothetical protein
MISFEQAIEVATKNAKSLIENSRNIVLEGVLISDDKKLYEFSLSYDLQGNDPFEVRQDNDGTVGSGLSQLVKIMGYRKQYKTFLVDGKSGEFRGFRNQKGS